MFCQKILVVRIDGNIHGDVKTLEGFLDIGYVIKDFISVKDHVIFILERGKKED